MNRMEEYNALQAQLEQSVPAENGSLLRAKTRLRRRNERLCRSAASVCTVFVLFVVLVNFCAPVAYACSKVPGLRELAEAVTFSRSLTDAVNNEYVQPIALKQTQNGITATVEHLIVDQKQVNVFFRLTGEGYESLVADPEVLDVDAEHMSSCSTKINDHHVPVGKLQSVTFEKMEGEVPGKLLLKLRVFEYGNRYGNWEAPERVPEDAIFEEPPSDKETAYLAEFEFLIEFDPTFTARAKVYPICQTVDLEGKLVTLDRMEVYPTHLRLVVKDDHPENEAWLQRLYFHIETDWGMKFEVERNGIVSFGNVNDRVFTYRADSTYFYKANHLRVVITAAEWLNKDMETVYVNLVTGETGKLPEDVTFMGAEKREGGWLVSFKGRQRKWSSDADAVHHQLFDHGYLDAEGNEAQITSWTTSSFVELPEAEWDTHFGESFPLVGYYADEVWLKPHYSHVWLAENPIVVTVQ